MSFPQDELDPDSIDLRATPALSPAPIPAPPTPTLASTWRENVLAADSIESCGGREGGGEEGERGGGQGRGGPEEMRRKRLERFG